jgi:hypothetical protein
LLNADWEKDKEEYEKYYFGKKIPADYNKKDRDNNDTS